MHMPHRPLYRCINEAINAPSVDWQATETISSTADDIPAVSLIQPCVLNRSEWPHNSVFNLKL